MMAERKMMLLFKVLISKWNRKVRVKLVMGPEELLSYKKAWV